MTDADELRAQLLRPWSLRLYFLGKLPLALLAGLRIRTIDREQCQTSVPYRWITTNPFRSTYFAALSMAAELSTGALALVATQSAEKSVAVLIVGMTAEFTKKATDLTTFTCEDGLTIEQAVQETLRTGEAAAAEVETVGRNEAGDVVATFTFRWSFKVRGSRQ